MIKSVIENKEVKKELPFPKLMISEVNREIVLFSEAEVGVVMHKGTTFDRLYVEVDDFIMSKFTDFHGSITLSNEE